MAKIKRKIRNLPILHTFMLTTLFFILLAMLLVECEKTVIRNAQYAIAFQYSDTIEGFNAVKVWGDNSTYLLSEFHSNFMQFYELLNGILSPLTYFLCLFIAGLLFYKRKIQQPLFLLTSAVYKISDSDLDFSLSYDRQDEMGRLCFAFEKMRAALEGNNRETWRQMDERKRLNTTFSHDLRTPLTVLEGYLGILQKYMPENKLSMEDITGTYKIMAEQIERLKGYVSSMNTLQRLEDIPVTRKSMNTIEFIQQLKDTASIISGKKGLSFFNNTKSQTLNIAPEIVMQVFENILSNAARYAKNSISVTCYEENKILFIDVADDGNGFDNSTIKYATTPFYTTEKTKNSQHFGLGLNICKILCERHNGDISLVNNSGNGALVTVTFGM